MLFLTSRVMKVLFFLLSYIAGALPGLHGQETLTAESSGQNTDGNWKIANVRHRVDNKILWNKYNQ